MNENRAVGLMTVLVTLPGLAWAWNDFRNGTVRLLLFSRMRSAVSMRREADPLRFWVYTAFNILLLALLLVGGATLMVKS